MADVFASADMQHPITLMQAGKGRPVAVFMRNWLCALAQPHVVMTPATVPDIPAPS
jgi:hypothetical protein